MSYLQKNNSRGRGFSKILAGTLLILAIVFLSRLVAPRLLSESVFSLAMPLWKAENYIVLKLENLSSWLKQKQALASENKALREETDAAKAQLQTLNAYKEENETLRTLLGRSSSERRILASVLAKPKRSLYDTLVIDVGREEGVVAGDMVVSQNFIIGTIKETLAHQSKVGLFSSQGEIFEVVIGDKNIQAEAIGKGGSNFTIKTPKDLPVEKGDMVKLPGASLKFFGTVEAVEKTVTSSFQLIMFTLPVNINEISWVEVVKK